MGVATAVASSALPVLPATAAEVTGSISGVVFEDANRNGVLDAGESPWSGHVLYLFDEQGGYVRAAQSDAQGRYGFTDLPAATYEVRYASNYWWDLREGWTPTTTGTLLPRQRVAVAGSVVADFGWRPLVRSTTAGQPVTSFTGPTGLRVESYNDAVPAEELHEVLASGTLGSEAPSVVVRFALSGSSTTTTSVGATAGRYDRFAALVYVSWLSWLDSGSSTLSHEYGHAWAMYRGYLVQQDPELSAYLEVRGLAADDPRLDTNHAWGRDELVAEDYRQLLGPPEARGAQQMNTELPSASAVPGLRDYLLGPFSGPATATTAELPPAAPSSLTGVAGNGHVALSWAAPSGAVTGYRVYPAGSATAVATVPASSTSATISGLTNGTSYTYAVRAYGDGGESASSNTVTLAPQAPPLAVDQLSATSSRTGVTIGFRLSEQAQVTVTVVDRAGTVVRTVVDRQAMAAGTRSVVWDGKDSSGRKVRLTGLSAVVRAQAADGRTATASRLLG